MSKKILKFCSSSILIFVVAISSAIALYLQAESALIQIESREVIHDPYEEEFRKINSLISEREKLDIYHDPVLDELRRKRDELTAKNIEYFRNARRNLQDRFIQGEFDLTFSQVWNEKGNSIVRNWFLINIMLWVVIFLFSRRTS